MFPPNATHYIINSYAHLSYFPALAHLFNYADFSALSYYINLQCISAYSLTHCLTWLCLFACFCFHFEAGSQMNQAGLELLVHLPLPPECWVTGASMPSFCGAGMDLRVWCILMLLPAQLRPQYQVTY